MPTPRLRLGQLLVDARMITAEALDEVLAAQRSDGRRLGTLLVERGLINETQLTQILSHQLAVPWVSLLHIEFSRQLLNLVPREVADRFCLVPIYVRHVRNQGDTLYVAMDDPSNEDGLKACREHSGLPVRAMIAPPTDIRSAIRVYYGVDSPVSTLPPRDVPSKPAPINAPQDLPSTRREPAARPVASPPPAEARGAQPDAVPPAPVAQRELVEALPPIQEQGCMPEPQPEPPTTKPESVDEVELISEPAPPPAPEAPHIEAVELELNLERAERLRAALVPPEPPPPPSAPDVPVIPRPRGRAPRMVSLTLLDGTTITLPAKRRARRPADAAPESAPGDSAHAAAPTTGTVTSEPPPGDNPLNGMTARDLVLALRVVANGADASEVLGESIRWEALFSALLSLLLKKHLIADWEFVDELKKQL
jgi:type IV pilus assembly protein PilB